MIDALLRNVLEEKMVVEVRVLDTVAFEAASRWTKMFEADRLLVFVLVVTALPMISELLEREAIKAFEQDSPRMVALEFTIRLQVLVVPATSNVFEGVVVLIPTSPALSIRMRLLPLVISPSLLKSGR